MGPNRVCISTPHPYHLRTESHPVSDTLCIYDLEFRTMEKIQTLNDLVTLDRSVGIATGYCPEGQGSILLQARAFLSLQRQDRLVAAPSLLYNLY
jgi:hypothetical protein